LGTQFVRGWITIAFDAHKNFAFSTVLTAPSPATSGTSLVVQAADGTKFPAASFNAFIWPANAQPTTANAEIVRVTAISTDTFTITRAQESTTARTVIVGDQIAAGVTAKTITDIESGALLTASALADAAATSRKVQLQYAVAQANQAGITGNTTWNNIGSATITLVPAVASVALLTLTGTMYSSAVNGRIDVRIYDATTSTQIGYLVVYSATASQRVAVAISMIKTLTAVSHTINAQWSDQAGGGNTITIDGNNTLFLNGTYWSQ